MLLDLRGKLPAFRERLFELRARLCLSAFERGGLLPVFGLPLLAIRDLRIESRGQTLPLGLMLLDLRGKLLPFRERLFELLARSLSVRLRARRTAPGTPPPSAGDPRFAHRGPRSDAAARPDTPRSARQAAAVPRAPVRVARASLSVRLRARRTAPGTPPPSAGDPRFAHRGPRSGAAVRPDTPPICTASCRRSASARSSCSRFSSVLFERGGSAPVFGLPLLAIRDLRIERRGQTLPLGLILLDLRGKLPAFRERLFELSRASLSPVHHGLHG